MTEESGDVTKHVLRPRARIMRTLGDQLISSETVALIELVKNAYDADARIVVIRFGADLAAGAGVIEVADNGHGMTLDVVAGAWMEPATDRKKQKRTSPALSRRMLGEKGIGRFAAARLAETLQLVTRPAGGDEEIVAEFRWKQFDDPSLYLDQVQVPVFRRAAETIREGWPLPSPDAAALPPQGTLLRMEKLNRSWGSAELADLRRGLSRLVSPFATMPDFRILLEVPDQEKEYSHEIAPPEVIRYPHYLASGAIDAQGGYDLSITDCRSGAQHKLHGRFVRNAVGVLTPMASIGDLDLVSEVPIEHRPVCGPFELELRVWDRDNLEDVEQKLGTGIRSIRKDLDAVAGVNIYRDGFRVLPYGEPKDDWLRLDMRRVQNPTLRLSNNQITGYIAIGADANQLLRDQSNREGLERNQAYSDLDQMMIAILAKLEELRYLARRDPKRPSHQGPAGMKSPTREFDELRNAFQQKLPDDDPAMILLDRTGQEISERFAEIQQSVSRYHALATMGSLVDKVIHEGRQPLASINRQAGMGHEQFQDLLDPDADGEVEVPNEVIGHTMERFRKISSSAAILDGAFRRLEPFAGRKRGRPAQVYLEKVIRDAFEHFAPEIRQHGIDVSTPQDAILVSVDAAEIQEIFVNLLSNSVHWLEHVPQGKRKILVQCAQKEDLVEVVFADSGPGVSESARSLIFDPYYTTRPGGFGLGLTIAGEIARDYYDGTLELMGSGPLPGAVFKVVLKKRIHQ